MTGAQHWRRMLWSVAICLFVCPVPSLIRLLLPERWRAAVVRIAADGIESAEWLKTGGRPDPDGPIMRGVADLRARAAAPR